jgi:AcrR family transcriptional regulator
MATRKRSLVLRLREAARDQTALALLDAAEHVFATHGLHGARMGQIAHHAGVAVGTVYNYFADRETILRALIERRGQELDERITAACLVEPERFADAVRAIVAAFAGTCAEHGRFTRLLMTTAETSVYREELMGPIVVDVRAKVTEVMQRGVARGALRKRDPEVYTRTLLGLVKSLILEVGDAAPLSTDAIVELFLDGAAAR